MKKITFIPIGYARNTEKKVRVGSFKDVVTKIIVVKKYEEALSKIEDYSHVMIVYWMDKVKDQVITHRPQGNPDVPVVGIFSCRCPERPNPLGVSTVEVVSKKDNILQVKGLDILDGTPIVDIKPYWPVYDKVNDAKIPDWVNKLDL